MSVATKSSKGIVAPVLSRFTLCPKTTSWLKVDDSKADDQNPDQETSAENLEFFNEGLEKCLEKLVPCFKARYDGKDASGPGASEVALEVLLHPPVYTCEQAHNLCPRPTMNNGETLAMKNLFLRDKKKKFYLLSACVDTEIKMKELKFAKSLGFAAPEYLKEKMNLLPGSVTPFGLLNDGNPEAGEDCSIEFHLDPKVMESLAHVVDFHPNACNATICMRTGDFVEFMEQETKHKVNVLDLE